MIKLKEKSDFVQLEIDGDFGPFTYERFIYVNPAFIINIYQSHSWHPGKVNEEGKVIHEYYVYVANPPHNNLTYRITKDCYSKLVTQFMKYKNIHLQFC